MKKNLSLSWPDSLADITLKNMNMTELWFLRHTIDAGEGEVLLFAEMAVRTPKFGYEECYVDVENTRYLVKHKTWIGARSDGDCRNMVFYVQKHKTLIGQ